MNSGSFSVGRHELDHRRASIPRTTARNSAPDPGYPEGARAEKRSASRRPSVVTSVDRDESGRRVRGLQIARRLLAPLGHDVVADLLAFHQATHAGALHRAECTNTSLLPSLGSMNPKPFWVLKNFTVPVAIMASLHCIAFYPITRASRGRSSNFGGAGWAP